MMRALDSFVDKGCWISHDRVYGFVSASHGITEIGYHGLQPVSKNSRVFVQDSGVISFAIRKEKREIPLQTSVIDWQPSSITATTPFPEGRTSLTIQAFGRGLKIQCSAHARGDQVLVLRIAKNSLFSDVHGLRTWRVPQMGGKVLRCSFRDQIMLQGWLNRTGSYAGDFLIPEPVRKRIFKTSKRSGLATRDDLRPEFQSNDVALYDTETFVEIKGDACSIRETEDAWILEQRLSMDVAAGLTIRFSDSQSGTTPEKDNSMTFPTEASRASEVSAQLRIEGYRSIAEFVQTVPGLVDSCIVQDYGTPRACPGRYYWIWAWDSLVSMMEALRWGDHSHVSSTVRFIEQHNLVRIIVGFAFNNWW